MRKELESNQKIVRNLWSALTYPVYLHHCFWAHKSQNYTKTLIFPAMLYSLNADCQMLVSHYKWLPCFLSLLLPILRKNLWFDGTNIAAFKWGWMKIKRQGKWEMWNSHCYWMQSTSSSWRGALRNLKNFGPFHFLILSFCCKQPCCGGNSNLKKRGTEREKKMNSFFFDWWTTSL